MEAQYRQDIEAGRKFDTLKTHTGWTEVFIPWVQKMLSEEDKKCHDVRIREDLGKYHLGKYNAYKKVLEFADEVEKRKRIAIDSFERSRIPY